MGEDPTGGMSEEELKLENVIKRNPHLGRYYEEMKAKGREPEWFPRGADRSMKEMDVVDAIYNVGEPVFIHIWDDEKEHRHYTSIEPDLTEEERKKYLKLRDRVLQLAPYEPAPETEQELTETLDRILDKVITRKSAATSKIPFLNKARYGTVALDDVESLRIRYMLHRDIVGSGPIEPLIRDPNIEDISSIGIYNIFVIHKLFDTLETNVSFRNDEECHTYLRNMSERIGRPVSESRPIVDATLPDGSRINIIYSDDVSQRGPSFTIRKFSETPIPITQIVAWGTMSSQVAAYLWICLRNGMSLFVCGETASGKTTTLNAALIFIQDEAKIFTAEDTPEVRPPQKLWQQLVTRSEGPEEGRVEMFDLLKAALRSRPEYIIVGEIRGAEGNVAFQAMQTGHPVIATFHAATVGKMIQRLTADPINVPATFMDNLNVCLIQMAVFNKGKMLRRVLAVEEIEGYSDHAQGVLTRQVFNWDPVKDRHVFRGRNNSYILEDKVATTMGLEDKREIYIDLDTRQKVLDRMIEEGVFDYYECNQMIRDYDKFGESGLPFTL